MLLLLNAPNKKIRITDPLRDASVYDLQVADLADLILMVAETLPDPQQVDTDDTALRKAAKLLHQRMTHPGQDGRTLLSVIESFKRRRSIYGRTWADECWYSPQRLERKRRIDFDCLLARLYRKYVENRHEVE